LSRENRPAGIENVVKEAVALGLESLLPDADANGSAAEGEVDWAGTVAALAAPEEAIVPEPEPVPADIPTVAAPALAPASQPIVPARFNTSDLHEALAIV